MDESVAGADPRQALDEVARQRNVLAGRIRMPGWYRVLYGVALVALFVFPALTARAGDDVSWPVVAAVQAPAVIVLGLQNAVIRRYSGARLPADTPRAFPSIRRPILATVAVVVIGGAVTWTTAVAVSWLVSLACGLVCAALVLVEQERALAAIRRDIRTGKAVAR
jgi:hypothetical protein